MRAASSRLATFGVLFLALTTGAAGGLAQTSSADNRRDAIATVQEKLADPDPAQRLANLEAIVQQNDPLLVQLAIRTAFASDDAALRSLAMQALLATTSEFTFEIAPPFASEANAPPGRRDVSREDRRVSERLANAGYRLHLVIKDYRFPAPSGTAEVVRLHPAPFVFRGRRFSARMLVGFATCVVEFAPTTRMELEGSLACEGGWPKLTISSAVF